jgi:protocatechuate 3,4-dioxygenase beta subunit
MSMGIIVTRARNSPRDDSLVFLWQANTNGKLSPHKFSNITLIILLT